MSELTERSEGCFLSEEAKSTVASDLRKAICRVDEVLNIEGA